MLMTDLLAHLVNSHKTPITTANAQICLRKINEVCPDWCSIVKLSDGKEVVKVNPQINICEVMLKLRKIHS